jgi:5-formyltetrahydrofolate cyclo-ligase
MGKGELRTGEIVETCLKMGTSAVPLACSLGCRYANVVAEVQDKKLYIPYLPPAASVPSAAEQTPTMDMLRLYSIADMEACPLDKWGILDPGMHRRDLQGEREDGTLSPSSSFAKGNTGANEQR